MNNKFSENGALTGPPIFTLPVFSLNLDWLDGPGERIVCGRFDWHSF